MARFYSEIQGNRGLASRMGTKDSGIWGHIRGWNIGIEVVGKVEDGEDVFYVYVTGGSSGHKTTRLIGKFKEDKENEEKPTDGFWEGN